MNYRTLKILTIFIPIHPHRWFRIYPPYRSLSVSINGNRKLLDHDLNLYHFLFLYILDV